MQKGQRKRSFHYTIFSFLSYIISRLPQYLCNFLFLQYIFIILWRRKLHSLTKCLQITIPIKVEASFPLFYYPRKFPLSSDMRDFTPKGDQQR